MYHKFGLVKSKLPNFPKKVSAPAYPDEIRVSTGLSLGQPGISLGVQSVWGSSQSGGGKSLMLSGNSLRGERAVAKKGLGWGGTVEGWGTLIQKTGKL